MYYKHGICLHGLSKRTASDIKQEQIYNINNNKEVKVIVVFKGKLKSTRGLLVYLVVIAVLYKVLNCLNLNSIACLLKDPK